ncbi:unnamed protein product, partial [marine sediment metagenome]
MRSRCVATGAVAVVRRLVVVEVQEAIERVLELQDPVRNAGEWIRRGYRLRWGKEPEAEKTLVSGWNAAQANQKPS